MPRGRMGTRVRTDHGGVSKTRTSSPCIADTATASVGVLRLAPAIHGQRLSCGASGLVSFFMNS